MRFVHHGGHGHRGKNVFSGIKVVQNPAFLGNPTGNQQCHSVAKIAEVLRGQAMMPPEARVGAAPLSVLWQMTG